jgi:NAD-dependent deacetylase
MRPAIVWFGEMLPQDVWLAAADAATSCGVLLSIGTSAAVYPAAGLIEMAAAAGAKTIEVNLEPTPASDLVDIAIHGKAGDIVPQLVA